MSCDLTLLESKRHIYRDNQLEMSSDGVVILKRHFSQIQSRIFNFFIEKQEEEHFRFQQHRLQSIKSIKGL